MRNIHLITLISPATSSGICHFISKTGFLPPCQTPRSYCREDPRGTVFQEAMGSVPLTGLLRDSVQRGATRSITFPAGRPSTAALASALIPATKTLQEEDLESITASNKTWKRSPQRIFSMMVGSMPFRPVVKKCPAKRTEVEARVSATS